MSYKSSWDSMASEHAAAWVVRDIFQRLCVCFVKCQPLSPAIVYPFTCFISVFSLPELLLCPNNLNRFCLSAQIVTLKQQIPLEQQKTTWRPVLQRNCCSDFSTETFEGISSWLSLVKMLFFFSAFLSVRGWPSEQRGGRGEPSE